MAIKYTVKINELQTTAFWEIHLSKNQSNHKLFKIYEISYLLASFTRISFYLLKIKSNISPILIHISCND